MKKKLKFKENTLSAKKFNQIIYESNKLSARHGFIFVPDNWDSKNIKFDGEKAKLHYKGKILKGKYEGTGTEIILQMGNYLEDVVSYYKGQWKNGKKNGKGFWSNHHPLIGRTWSLDAGKPYYVVTEDGDDYYYDGYWFNNKKHGKGIFVSKEGEFKGEFKKDIKWEGVLTYNETKTTNIKSGVSTLEKSFSWKKPYVTREFLHKIFFKNGKEFSKESKKLSEEFIDPKKLNKNK